MKNNSPLLVWYSRHYPSRAMMQELRDYRLLMFQPPRPHFPGRIWSGIKSLCEATDGQGTMPAAIMAVCPNDWRNEFVEKVWAESPSTFVIRPIMLPQRPFVWSGAWRVDFWHPVLSRVCWDAWTPLQGTEKNVG